MSNVAFIEQAPSVRFAATARLIAEVARASRLVVPAFKSPPRIEGVDRTIKRVGANVVVAVRVRNRPFGAVVADLIEGVVVANNYSGSDAGKTRALLWEAVEASDTLAA